MELLFVMLGSILIGIAVYLLMPRRESYGVALLPALSGAITAVLWAGLTWAGWRFDEAWIWLVSLIAGGAGCAVLGILLSRRREVFDERLFQELSTPS
jgi:hypothetical protein